MAIPRPRPNTVAMKKPARVVQSVTQELSAIATRYCHSAANTSEGAGRMVSGTVNAAQTISQTRNRASVNAAGETTLMAMSRRSISVLFL